MSFVKLTQPDGRPIFVSAAFVSRVRFPDGTWTKKSGSVLTVAGIDVAVMEDPAAALDALGSWGHGS